MVGLGVPPLLGADLGTALVERIRASAREQHPEDVLLELREIRRAPEDVDGPEEVAVELGQFELGGLSRPVAITNDGSPPVAAAAMSRRVDGRPALRGPGDGPRPSEQPIQSTRPLPDIGHVGIGRVQLTLALQGLPRAGEQVV